MDRARSQYRSGVEEVADDGRVCGFSGRNDKHGKSAERWMLEFVRALREGLTSSIEVERKSVHLGYGRLWPYRQNRC